MNSSKEKLTTQVLLWLFLSVSAVSWALADASGSQISVGTAIAERLALPVILASWVASDARMRRRSLCYDFDTFIFFAWPFVLPYYLFRTRGLRAFLTLFGLAGMCVAAILIGYGVLWLVRR